MADRNNNNLVKKGLQSGGQRPEHEGRMPKFRVSQIFIAPIHGHYAAT